MCVSRMDHGLFYFLPFLLRFVYQWVTLFCQIFSINDDGWFDLFQLGIEKLKNYLIKLWKEGKKYNTNSSQVSRQLPPVITGTYGRMILSVVWFPKINWQKRSPFLTVACQFPRLGSPREIIHKLGFSIVDNKQ